ncbi:sulfatase-like hydrolase/transferase [Ornithinibacillus sp. L9]|uniref:Sulfatase-like hydrolase/transferase n=1 Tax=Ornithinibacillus caprae TaxID=2678566 RepID=A0A6N8FL44_9BACI|nr:LTA synthase family protein [Ornithinibacillus caprae]MUK89446.1 sulfatase-like hydrolase/transferase [Ornithinibacillus caprae]
MKKIFTTKMSFFFVAVILLWIKSYFIYSIEFRLDIKGGIQEFLLFFNPLSSALIFLGLALFAKGKRAGIWIIVIDTIMTILLYANVVYYRVNNDYITLPTLTQTSNFGSLGGSIASLVTWTDILYAVDIIILIALFMWSKRFWSTSRMSFKKPLLVLIAGAIAFSVNLSMAEADRPQLLKRTFDRNYIVKYLGIYNFAVYDAIQNVKTSSQRVLADSDDITEVENYTKNKFAEPNDELFGTAAGKNIIKIHLESFQTFLIDYELHGEEVTPFLNSLVHDQEEDFTYFDNIFHQTEQGKTADAEFLLANSIYGLPQGAAFVTRGNNTYQAFPAILNQELDYTSAVFHGDYKSFWNRDEIYKQFGIDTYFDASYYNMIEENVINYGLKDKPFFEESMPLLESIDQPFYAHLQTLTHHHPYLISEEDATIAPAETGDASVDRYFQTARYLDEALEQFFTDLKEAGMYDDSVIILYGDHYGISQNHNRAMKELLGEEITAFKNAQLQRVPLFIKIPGVDGQGTNHNYGGLIDVMPTLMHLIGINGQDYIQFGTDLFSDEHNQVVPFRNGDVVTPEFSYVSGTYYDTTTGEELEPTEEMEEIKNTAQHELELSDKLLNGDLLRFYQPTEAWEPVDPSIYKYGKEAYDPFESEYEEPFDDVIEYEDYNKEKEETNEN